MSDSRRLPDDRLTELLAEQAEHGLDHSQQRELAELLEQAGLEMEDDGLALAAAAAYRVFESEAGTIHEPMPASLSDKLIAQGETKVAVRAGSEVSTPLPFRASQPTGTGLMNPAWGWLAAAAVLAISVTAWMVMSIDNTRSDYASQRERLIAEATDITQANWSSSDDPTYGKVTGDVVWSDREQRGYMRLAGMPVNDPGASQYQLWIVDPDVDTHPVDGGVFDVGSDGEVIIPIDAKLRIDKPTVFAITVEKPGGVVVSAGPLRVVAAVGT